MAEAVQAFTHPGEVTPSDEEGAAPPHLCCQLNFLVGLPELCILNEWTQLFPKEENSCSKHGLRELHHVPSNLLRQLFIFLVVIDPSQH